MATRKTRRTASSRRQLSRRAAANGKLRSRLLPKGVHLTLSRAQPKA